MNIEFKKEPVKNENGGINFFAEIDKQTILCVVSAAILQDINSDSRMDGVEQQFEDNKYRLQEIAENKIRNQEVENGTVTIIQDDVL